MGYSIYGNFAKCKVGSGYHKKKGIANKQITVTNDEVRGRAFGELNLTVRDFELLTYKEFEWYWVGYQRREKEKWRHTREILAFISNSRMGTKKAITGKELFPFEEEKQQLDDQSFEELLRLTK